MSHEWLQVLITPLALLLGGSVGWILAAVDSRRQEFERRIDRLEDQVRSLQSELTLIRRRPAA